MSIQEAMHEFGDVKKGPPRVFNAVQCNGFVLYSLPNAICIFEYRTDLQVGRVYRPVDHDLGINFKFEVIENTSGTVVIKKIQSMSEA